MRGIELAKKSWRWPMSCTIGWATYPNWSRSVRRGSPVTPKRSLILWARAADALSQIYGHSANPATGFKARDCTAIREFSCIHGYATSIVEVL